MFDICVYLLPLPKVPFLSLNQTMALQVERLKKIDQRIQFIVFGFIRDAQILLPSIDKPYNIIPDLVTYIVLNFYYQCDYFDTFSKNRYQCLNENRTKLGGKSGQTGTAYGSEVLVCNSNYIYEYKFKILFKKGWIVIGIDTANNECIHSDFYFEDRSSYAYATGGGVWANGVLTTKYGDTYHANDIIEMIIDMKSMNICWKNNDQQYKTINIKPTEINYRIAVGCSSGSSLEILSAISIEKSE